MKVFVLVFVIFAVIASALALKHAKCGLEHSKDGDGLRACLALMPSWSYNSKTNECVQFNYGGCGGNDNRFGLKEDCEKLCKE